MSEAIILALIAIGEMVITSVVTFLLTKRKYRTEVDNGVIENMQKSLNFYKELSDDNRKRLEKVLEENSQIQQEMFQMRKIMMGMLSQICTDLVCQNRKIDQARINKELYDLNNFEQKPEQCTHETYEKKEMI